MLSQDSFDSAQSTAPSVTEEDIDNEDDAMELLGNCKKYVYFLNFLIIKNQTEISQKLLPMFETEVFSSCVKVHRV